MKASRILTITALLALSAIGLGHFAVHDAAEEAAQMELAAESGTEAAYSTKAEGAAALAQGTADSGAQEDGSADGFADEEGMTADAATGHSGMTAEDAAENKDAAAGSAAAADDGDSSAADNEDAENRNGAAANSAAEDDDGDSSAADDEDAENRNGAADDEDAEDRNGAAGNSAAEDSAGEGEAGAADADPTGTGDAESPKSGQSVSSTKVNQAIRSSSASSQNQGQADVWEAAVPTYKYDTGYILMGDSRFYLMNLDCDIHSVENFFVVCCPGMGYQWMITRGLPQIEAIETAHPEIKDWVVVSGLGINDMGNISSYIRTYRTLSKKMDLRLLSVNPTMGQSDPKYSNSSIEAFNQRLQRFASTNSAVDYINCYDYLTQKGYWMTDGIHYNVDSNWDILAFLLDSLCPQDLKEGLSGEQKTDREEYAQKLIEAMSTPNY